MHGLNNLVASGKVLYLGISDTPAWVVVKANDYARSHGLRPFSVYQGQWNAGCRSLEAEVIPMCIDQGMAIVPWGPVGGGKFKSRAVRAKTATDTGSPRGDDLDDEHIKISEVLEDVADEKGTTLHAVVCDPDFPVKMLTVPADLIGPCIRPTKSAICRSHCRPAEGGATGG